MNRPRIKKKLTDEFQECFKLAFVVGLPPSEFWKLTPWQFGQCIEAYQEKQDRDHNKGAWMMWHGAVLARVKTIPKLKDFLVKKKPVKGIDEAAIMAWLQSHNGNDDGKPVG